MYALYPFAILILTGIGINFFGAHYLNWVHKDNIIRNKAERFTQKESSPLLKKDKDYLESQIAPVPEEFSLEKHNEKQTKALGKLALSSDLTSIPFPQNKGDSYEWSPLDGYVIEGTVDSIARNIDSKSFGVNLKNGLGRFIYRESPARAGAIVFFNN